MAYYYPSGMILAFDTACPSGWTRVSAWDSKFIMGNATYGTTGGTQSHIHDCTPGAKVSWTASAGDSTVGGTDGSCSTIQHSHSVTYSTTATSNVTNNPPYINVIFCKKD